MSTTFILVLIVAFGLQPSAIPDPSLLAQRLGGCAAGVLAVIAFAHWIGWRAAMLLERPNVDRRAVLRRYYVLRRLHAFLSFAVYLTLLLHFEWHSVVLLTLNLDRWPLVGEVAVLAPYLIAEVLSWNGIYAVDCAAVAAGGDKPTTRREWGRFQYLSFQFRTSFGIVLAASMMVSVVRDLAIWLLPKWTDSALATMTAVGLTSLSVLVLSPWIIRLVWHATPMPRGPMREQLEWLGRKLGFRYSDILIWHTNHGVVNAAVSGIFPQLRYVLLSDALLAELTPDEVAAVFGHEVGHVRHHHLSYYFIFVVASVVLIGMTIPFFNEPLRRLINEMSWGWGETILEPGILDLVLFVPYLLIAFGFLSRRFERQADVFGSRAASTVAASRPMAIALPAAAIVDVHGSPNASAIEAQVADAPAATAPIANQASSQTQGKRLPVTREGVGIFVAALEKVAVLNGMTRNAWSWRHGSIGQRITFLERIVALPDLADRFDRALGRLRWILIGMLSVGIAAAFFAGNR